MEIVVGYPIILVVSSLGVSDNNSFMHFSFINFFCAKTAFFCLHKEGRIPIGVNFKHRLCYRLQSTDFFLMIQGKAETRHTLGRKQQWATRAEFTIPKLYPQQRKKCNVLRSQVAHCDIRSRSANQNRTGNEISDGGNKILSFIKNDATR